MNIKTLASLANVSISTVSKALNDSPEISQQTKKRIKALAEENGFFLSPRARSQKKQKTNCIAIIFSRKTFFNFDTTLLCATIQELLMKEVEKHGYSYTIGVSRDVNGQSMLKHIYYQNIVDGFILASDDITKEEMQFLQTNEVPFVFAEIAPDNLPSDVNYFLNDDFADGYHGTLYLIKKGLKRITTISNPSNYSDYFQRTEGYKKAMSENGLEPVVIEHSMNQREAETILHHHYHTLLSSEALFIQWDGMAGVMMQCLFSCGLKVPDTISVLGYNDFPVASYFRPELTTIRDARKKQCENAVKHLVDMLRGTTHSIIQSRLEGTIVERESVRK